MKGTYFMPTRIIMGKDAVMNNSSALRYGNKALIVTGRSSSKKNGSLKDIEIALTQEAISYVVYD